MYVPEPFGFGGVVIFQGFAVMERLGTPQKQKNIGVKNIGVKNLGRPPASAGAQPKAEPKVETKPGEKRKRSKR